MHRHANQLRLGEVPKSRSGRWEAIAAPGASLFLWREFLPPSRATSSLKNLQQQVLWQRDTVKVYGKEHPVPRLHQWYGDPGTAYTWSGITMQPQPWSDELVKLRRAVERATRRPFDSVLVNLYRNGHDCMGWHADNEPVFGKRPVIASLSLGAERDFVLRARADHSQKVVISLPHGSLLVMAGETQARWQHALPRRKKVTSPRINLTFRKFM